MSLCKIFQSQGSENLLTVLIISACIVFTGNGMVFNFLISQFYWFVFIKLSIFLSFLTIFVILKVDPASGAKEPPLEFDNKLLYSF